MAFDSASLSFSFYLQGVLVGTSETFTVGPTYTFFPSGFSGPVDTVFVNNHSADLFIMKGIRGRPLPEPSSVVLAGLGFAALLLCSLRRANS